MVDNGGQWTHREWRMLKYLKVDTQIIEKHDAGRGTQRKLDGLILSGEAARVGLSGELGSCAEYLDLNIPILSICAGHQFMARHYGGDARESPELRIWGDGNRINRRRGAIISKNTNATQIVWESHNEEVHILPEKLFCTARSESCQIQGMEKNNEGDRFGLQFHPEVNDSEFGKEIFENFVSICRKYKQSQN